MKGMKGKNELALDAEFKFGNKLPTCCLQNYPNKRR